MGTTTLDIDKILTRFDALEAAGELFYSPASPSRSTHGSLDFEFRVVPSFRAKPHLSKPGSSHVELAQSARRAPPTDGSDIDHSDPAFFVAWVGAMGPTSNTCDDLSTRLKRSETQYTHKLILNKFCVARPQYLLLTTDPKERQTEVLKAKDLHAAWTVLAAMREQGIEGYVVYNGGPEAGSSRAHKHLQVLECPDGIKDRKLLWSALNLETGENELLPLPYLAWGARLHSRYDELVKESLVKAYRYQFEQCQRALRASRPDFGGGSTPHNIIFTSDYIITFPRASNTVKGISGHTVGAQGMLGLVWCNDDAQISGWINSDPIEVLKALGLPNPDWKSVAKSSPETI